MTVVNLKFYTLDETVVLEIHFKTCNAYTV